MPARGPAVRAVPLDPDVIHVAAAMDARAQVGLGDGHRSLARLAWTWAVRRAGSEVRAGRSARDRAARRARLGLVERLFLGVAAVLQAGVLADLRAEDRRSARRRSQDRKPASSSRALAGEAFSSSMLLDIRSSMAGSRPRRRGRPGQGRFQAGDQGRLAVGADPFQDHLDHGFPPGLALIQARRPSCRGRPRPWWNMARTDRPWSAISPMMLSTRNGASS